MQYGLGDLGETAYSPDGRLIATAGSYGVGLWDAENGQEKVTLREQNRVSPSRDTGAIIASSATAGTE